MRPQPNREPIDPPDDREVLTAWPCGRRDEIQGSVVFRDSQDGRFMDMGLLLLAQLVGKEVMVELRSRISGATPPRVRFSMEILPEPPEEPFDVRVQ